MSGSALSADAIGKAPLQITKQVHQSRKRKLLHADNFLLRRFSLSKFFFMTFFFHPTRINGRLNGIITSTHVACLPLILEFYYVITRFLGT